jgi:ADP-heptose:LPS heptosyltransferase
MYTDVVERPRELRRRHSVENQWDLLRPLGVGAPSRTSYPVEMPLDQTACAAVRRRLSALALGNGDTLTVMHVSASSPFRRWPLASFVETAAALARRPNGHVLLTSGPDDHAAVARIVTEARAALPPDARARVIDGRDVTLAELRALLERASLYIGGDSGPLHVAATTAVPIVAIFGPTPSQRSAPWRDPALACESLEVEGLPCRPCDQRACAPGDFRCLTGIAASTVIATAERLLDAPARLQDDPA